MSGTSHIVGVYIETDMRDAFAHLQRLSYTYYSNTKVGRIMGRINNDLFDAPNSPTITGRIFLCGHQNCGFVHHPVRGQHTADFWWCLACVTLMAVVSHQAEPEAFAPRSAASGFQIGELNASIEDSLLGQRVVKGVKRRGRGREQKFRQGNTAFQTIKKKTYHAMAAFNTSTRLFDGLMLIWWSLWQAAFRWYMAPSALAI